MSRPACEADQATAPAGRAGAALLVLAIGVAACGEDSPTAPPPDDLADVVASDVVRHDPTGFAPLSAEIALETEIPVSVTVRVVGLGGADTDVRHTFPEAATSRRVPVLGLYPDLANTVELTLRDEEGRELGTRSYTVETPPLSEHMPSVEIDRAVESEMAEGLTLVSYYGHGGDPSPNRPFMFDRDGSIRWVLEYDGHDELGTLAYSDGIHRLRNGNLYFGDERTDRIYEVDMLGRIVETWGLSGFEFHHEVTELPNGNFLASVTNPDISTIEDHVVEVDRASGQLVETWDLRQSLDYDRTTWTDDRTDWVHVNAVTYDDRDDAIIVSGRTQGVVKLTRDNEVVWILAPHRGWGTAGDGTELGPFLLQPLDDAGGPITEPAVLEGDQNHPDFQWNWYQHAPVLTPEGNVLLFDNGDDRNYTGAELYSRAVEYDVDPDAGTVRQVWDYGEERGEETFSRIVSDVDFGGEGGHVFFSSGAVSVGGRTYGKVVELDHPGEQVLFEATITPPQPIFIITFHRTQRLPLYPED